MELALGDGSGAILNRQEDALRPLGLWASGQVCEDWAALKQGNGLDELSMMSELWEAQTDPGPGFLVSCFSRRTEKWSKVVGTFHEDGTVFSLPQTPKTSQIRGSSGTVFGLELGSPVFAETWDCQLSPEAFSSLCLAFSPSQAGWGGFCGHSVQIYRYPIAARFLSPIFTQASVGPSSLPATAESQTSRCFLQGLIEEDGQWTACSRLAGSEGPKTQ